MFFALTIPKIISIHAPRTGSDGFRRRSDDRLVYFNPRSPHGERQQNLDWAYKSIKISIHAPRTGSDQKLAQNTVLMKSFQSTLPARGATCSGKISATCGANFNPRSPHGERPGAVRAPYSKNNFNPRSPHGERQCVKPSAISAGRFQSTLPARGATRTVNNRTRLIHISIHAPRTGSDFAAALRV